jgi:hypothetical protein
LRKLAVISIILKKVALPKLSTVYEVEMVADFLPLQVTDEMVCGRK